MVDLAPLPQRSVGVGKPIELIEQMELLEQV